MSSRSNHSPCSIGRNHLINHSSYHYYHSLLSITMEKQETRDFRTKNRVSLRVTAQHYFHRALRRAHFSDIPSSSSNATTQRTALSFLADKEFGRDRRSSRESKVRRGARGVSRKPETPERRWEKKRTTRSGARCGMV